MANIDVTDLLADPDFANDFTIIRTTQVVDATGNATDQPQTFWTWGVIGPASGATLMLLPDEQRTQDTIRVITPFNLVSATDTTEADMVFWENRYYRVTLLNQYDNWGKGFSDATCTLTAYTPPTPDAPDPSTLE